MKTRIEIRYPRTRGQVFLRGEAPLDWREPTSPTRVRGDANIFELDLEPGLLIELKPVRGDGEWATGRARFVLAGESIVIEPRFERVAGLLEDEVHSIPAPFLGREIDVQIFLPPSYDEHTGKRYPVLYAQDGQCAFAPDPIDGRSLGLDAALNELWEIDVIEELILVAIHTDRDRALLLTPTRDAESPEGGGAAGYRDWIAGILKPWVDGNYRTLGDRDCTGLLGSSMGGLFSFFAAWSRSDVFGKVACLSGSFWWNDRWMIRTVRRKQAPDPLPWIYLDSGAASSPFEEEPNLTDGLHHVTAMHAALAGRGLVTGRDLHLLAFPGMEHGNASWSSRIHIPLQLMFPRR